MQISRIMKYIFYLILPNSAIKCIEYFTIFMFIYKHIFTLFCVCTAVLMCISASSRIRHNTYYTKEKIFGTVYFQKKLSKINIDATDLN